MGKDLRSPVSRRNLFRALLGRDTPSGPAASHPGGNPHARGEAAYEAGDYTAAVGAYRASIRADLSNAPVRARLGYALYVTGQFIQARVEFEHVLRLTAGNDGFSRMGLGLTWLALGKAQRAAAILADFEDATRPELAQAAKAIAGRLECGEIGDCAPPRRELERMAEVTALFPEKILV